MIFSKILKAFSKETKDGYLIQESELSPDIQAFLEERGNDTVLLTENESAASTAPKEWPRYEPILRIKNPEEENVWRFANIKTLSEQIRPHQGVIFTAIHTILTQSRNDHVDKASGFEVDLPLKSEEEANYCWVRCALAFNKTEITRLTLIPDQPWQGEPFFPRLIIENEAVAIPNDVRKEIYAEFLKLHGLKKCPLSETERLMLRVAYSMPDNYSYVALRTYTYNGGTLDGIAKRYEDATIKEHFKAFTKEAKSFFGIHFKVRKHVPYYWVEMGFDIEPIPEQFPKWRGR